HLLQILADGNIVLPTEIVLFGIIDTRRGRGKTLLARIGSRHLEQTGPVGRQAITAVCRIDIHLVDHVRLEYRDTGVVDVRTVVAIEEHGSYLMALCQLP